MSPCATTVGMLLFGDHLREVARGGGRDPADLRRVRDRERAGQIERRGAGVEVDDAVVGVHAAVDVELALDRQRLRRVVPVELADDVACAVRRLARVVRARREVERRGHAPVRVTGARVEHPVVVPHGRRTGRDRARVLRPRLRRHVGVRVVDDRERDRRRRVLQRRRVHLVARRAGMRGVRDRRAAAAADVRLEDRLRRRADARLRGDIMMSLPIASQLHYAVDPGAEAPAPSCSCRGCRRRTAARRSLHGVLQPHVAGRRVARLRRDDVVPDRRVRGIVLVGGDRNNLWRRPSASQVQPSDRSGCGGTRPST